MEILVDGGGKKTKPNKANFEATLKPADGIGCQILDPPGTPPSI
ncbi:MAG: hypothetical protein ACYTFW_08680 [Planctomycetota bacterium]